MSEGPANKTIRATDADAIALAKRLIKTARHGALAVHTSGDSPPNVSRIQTSTDVDGTPVTLVSSLSLHTQAMIEKPNCSILLGDVGKGDPLAHARITCFVVAEKIDHGSDTHRRLRDRHLRRHPKAALYADFGDFSFFKFMLKSASLNGGFGKAYNLSEDDLRTHGDIDGITHVESEAVQHMNEDHSDAVALYARSFAGSTPGNWKLATLDPEAMIAVDGDRVVSIDFPEPLTDAGKLRSVLSLMAKRARAAESENLND